MSGNFSSLTRRLGELAANGARELRRTRVRRAVRAALARDGRFLFLLPCTAVALEVARISGLVRTGPVSLPLVALGAVLVTSLFLGASALLAARRVPGRREALAVADEELGFEDRLLAADEFLAAPERSRFMEAAIEDAEAALGARPSWEFARSLPELGVTRHLARPAAGGLLAVILTAWLGTLGSPTAEGLPEAELASGPAAVEARSDPARDLGAPPEPPAPPPAAKESGQPSPRGERAPPLPDRATDLEGDLKESEGATGSGRQANALSTSGASNSRGVPSQQSQTTKADAPAPKKTDKKPVKKKESRPGEKPPRKSEDDSGSTAGRGSSRGSSKNPAASSWSSKDQVTSQDDQEIEEDDETEDEEEDQEARGGVQPALRDRKPPVSRDLRIGFGNQKNPDANGRGGPSQAKKSRGVASLVLGVPIPDRIKGQPGPGKTKITQERIEPRADEWETAAAEPRRSREGPVGPLSRPRLELWMQDLVRAYFLALRNTPKDGND